MIAPFRNGFSPIAHALTRGPALRLDRRGHLGEGAQFALDVRAARGEYDLSGSGILGFFELGSDALGFRYPAQPDNAVSRSVNQDPIQIGHGSGVSLVHGKVPLRFGAARLEFGPPLRASGKPVRSTRK